MSDDLFLAAQELLDGNADRMADFRNADGTLDGSDGSSNGRQHLLHRILCCEECGRYFYVGGSRSKYLYCPGYRDGVCSCKRQLRRDLAKELLIATIVERLEQTSPYVETVHQQLQQEWQRRQRTVPSEQKEAEEDLKECERQIQNYVASIGQVTQPDPAIHAKLNALREEEKGHKQKLALRRSVADETLPEPSIEWVRSRIEIIGQLLRDDDPLAIEAVRRLTGGCVMLRLCEHPASRRPFFHGEFYLGTGEVATAVADRDAGDLERLLDAADLVTVDFRVESRSEEQARLAWGMLKQGRLQKEIAKALPEPVSTSRAVAILTLGAKLFGEGLTLKEARTLFRKNRPCRPAPYEPYVQEAGQLFEQGVLYTEIAKRLGTHRDMITHAVREYFERRGLIAPDGRSRRKTLECKGRSRRSEGGDSAA